ncbi:hypothetical protein SeF2_078 [Salmonella phage SeF2]|uniref:Uncharacterized protein n=2 Tax=unclassified Caudoviricetes TaxID=2788787 RepID=A0AB39C2H9_9CAUD|nr:hypothetical protein SeF2_078 [Salmonella phage SeF2]
MANLTDVKPGYNIRKSITRAHYARASLCDFQIGL